MKNKILKLLSILTCCIMIASCDIDNSDNSNEQYRILSNTRWTLYKILNQNNEWLDPTQYSDLDIPELSFYSDRKYLMKIYNYYDQRWIDTVTGTYSISDNTINLTLDYETGIAFSINIISLNENALEGTITIWDEKQSSNTLDATTNIIVRNEKIRMKRTDK